MKFIVADHVKGKLFIEVLSRTLSAGQDFDLDENQYKSDSIQTLLQNSFIKSMEKDVTVKKNSVMVEMKSNSQNKLIVGESVVPPYSNFFITQSAFDSIGVKNAIKNGYISKVEQVETKKSKSIKKVAEVVETQVTKKLPTPLQAQKNQILNGNERDEDDDMNFADKKQEKERLDKFNKMINKTPR